MNELCDQLPNLLSKLPHLGAIVRLSIVNTVEDRFKLLGGLLAFIAEMEEAKFPPNVKIFTQLLDVIERTRDAEHDFIQKMRYMRVRADTDFFNLLMKRRIFRKDYDSAMVKEHGKIFILNVIDSISMNFVFVFFSAITDMIKKINLRPDIVTYGIMAMACINREQAKQFRKKLDQHGIR